MFTKSGMASVVIDGQFGSTGKGLIAAYLAKTEMDEGRRCDIATTNAGANAGHTTIIGGKKFVTFHLPTTAVVQNCRAYVNAGAIIDPKVLLQEIEEVGFDPSLLTIHPRAAVILDRHKEFENQSGSMATSLASTRKGVGAALADKVLRVSGLAQSIPELKPFIGTIDLNKEMYYRGARVVVEVPQGFSLGINSGLAYPYCTSRDVTVMQSLSDAGIHPSFLFRTVLSLRTFPIRVGNIVEDGHQKGWSGPIYPDQEEISFEDLGVPKELTTVTKRVRRIFTFSVRQYEDACHINRPDFVFLNFCNYLKTENQLRKLDTLMAAVWRAPTHFGCGPAVEDVVTSIEEVIKRCNLQPERQ